MPPGGSRQLRQVGSQAYLAKERPGAAASEPLFQVQYRWYGGEKKVRRMSGQRVGVDTIHPHAFRHACAVELLKRSGGNLRAVQEHLRHADIPDDDDLHAAGAAGSPESGESVRRQRRRSSPLGVSIPFYPGRKTFAENLNKNNWGIRTRVPTSPALFHGTNKFAAC